MRSRSQLVGAFGKAQGAVIQPVAKRADGETVNRQEPPPVLLEGNGEIAGHMVGGIDAVLLEGGSPGGFCCSAEQPFEP